MENLGHTVTTIRHDGKGPYDYVRTPALLNEVTSTLASFRPDITLYIFGHNDMPNERLRGAVARLRALATPKSIMTGPPLYADAASQELGAAVKEIQQSVFGPDYFDAYPYTQRTLPREPSASSPRPNPHFTLAGARPWGEAMARETLLRLTGAQARATQAANPPPNIRAGDWTYILTNEDKLWAGRMAQFEAGNPAATLWTMTQGYALPRKHQLFRTFTRFIQNYSQPINPRWALGGQFCPVENFRADGACAPNRLRTRERASTIAFEQLRPEIQQVTNDWFNGVLENPCPRAVEFADRRVGQNFLNRHPGSVEILFAGNRYIATTQSLRWPDNYVTMGAGTSTDGSANSRARTLVTTTRVGMYAAGNTVDAATVTARARAASRESQLETQTVVLPLVTSALAFDFVEGAWVNQTTRSVTPADHGPEEPPPTPETPPTTT